jgi:hypothetical protein
VEGRGGKVGQLDPTRISAGGRPGQGEGVGGVTTPAFTRASQNVATTAALLDALLAPYTDRVGEVYQCLKSILSAATVPQAERSLLHRVEASILPPPPRPQSQGTEGHPRSSRSRNIFLTRSLLDLRLTDMAECSVGTPDILGASPKG